MAKEEAIKWEGEVLEVLPGSMYRVKLDDSENVVLGYSSGKMKQFTIKIIEGDRVNIEFSPYDLTKGRITRRL